MTQKNWTPDEIRVLRKHYPGCGSKGCLKVLPHRTLGSIQTKAKHLKISFNPPMDYSPTARVGEYDERGVIVGEIRFMIDLTCHDRELERQQAHKLLDIIVEKNSLEWWHDRREWSLGKWLGSFIKNYNWDEEQEIYKDRVRELKAMLMDGSFDDFIDSNYMIDYS